MLSVEKTEISQCLLGIEWWGKGKLPLANQTLESFFSFCKPKNYLLKTPVNIVIFLKINLKKEESVYVFSFLVALEIQKFWCFTREEVFKGSLSSCSISNLGLFLTGVFITSEGSWPVATKL